MLFGSPLYEVHCMRQDTARFYGLVRLSLILPVFPTETRPVLDLDYFQEVSEEKLNDILRRVRHLSDGDKSAGLFTLESQVSTGGSNMSQGQRQLLCLARVIIKDPKIIILDEATSAVVNETDLWIQDTIRNEFNCTLVVVAHRLRTIASFDKVIVIDDGRIREIGTPAELLRARGLFYDLVQKSEDNEYVTNAANHVS